MGTRVHELLRQRVNVLFGSRKARDMLGSRRAQACISSSSALSCAQLRLGAGQRGHKAHVVRFDRVEALDLGFECGCSVARPAIFSFSPSSPSLELGVSGDGRIGVAVDGVEAVERFIPSGDAEGTEVHGLFEAEGGWPLLLCLTRLCVFPETSSGVEGMRGDGDGDWDVLAASRCAVRRLPAQSYALPCRLSRCRRVWLPQRRHVV